MALQIDTKQGIIALHASYPVCACAQCICTCVCVRVRVCVLDWSLPFCSQLLQLL